MSKNYVDTTGWFRDSELYHSIAGIVDPDTPNTFLEIGCFQGICSCFISDFFLDHPDSSLTCVDPFIPDDPTTPGVYDETKRIFYSNIGKSDNRNKITVHEQTSDEFFANLTKKFTFIYIDGDHRYESVKKDLTNASNALLPGGILWCDDYGIYDDVKRAVNEFFEEHCNMYNVLYVNMQAAFQKREDSLI